MLCVVLLCFVFFTPRVNQAHDWCHMWGGKIQFEPCLTAVWIKPLVASFLCTFWMGVIVSAIHNKSAFWQEQVFILCKGYLYRSHKYIASCHGPDHCPIYVSAHKQTLLDILSCLFLKARLRSAGRFWTAQHILVNILLSLPTALCDMHPMRALFLIPRNPAPRLKSKKWWVPLSLFTKVTKTRPPVQSFCETKQDLPSTLSHLLLIRKP